MLIAQVVFLLKRGHTQSQMPLITHAATVGEEQGNGASPNSPDTPRTKDSSSLGAHRRLVQDATYTTQQGC